MSQISSNFEGWNGGVEGSTSKFVATPNDSYPAVVSFEWPVG